jgi:hypothetical protein
MKKIWIQASIIVTGLMSTLSTAAVASSFITSPPSMTFNFNRGFVKAMHIYNSDKKYCA